MKNYIMFFLLAAFITMPFFGCKMPSTNIPEGSKTGSITGKALFTKEVDHAGITVILEKTDGLLSLSFVSAAMGIDSSERSIGAVRSLAGQTQTNADGSYTFNKVEPGTYTIYASSKDSLEKAVKKNLTVTAGGTIDAGILNLTPVGSINGRIMLDGSESGNLGFLVCVAGTSYMAISATDGSFAISGIPAGDGYLVIVMKENFIDFWNITPISVSGGVSTVLNPNPKEITSSEINNAKKKIQIGENGNWFIDGVDTGVKALGENGKDGVDGKDGKNQPECISIAAIPGVTDPAAGCVPVTQIETEQYSGSVAWAPVVSGVFAFTTVYEATITLAAKEGYTFAGLPADFFTVAGAIMLTNNRANEGIVTIRFPMTSYITALTADLFDDEAVWGSSVSMTVSLNEYAKVPVSITLAVSEGAMCPESVIIGKDAISATFIITMAAEGDTSVTATLEDVSISTTIIGVYSIPIAVAAITLETKRVEPGSTVKATVTLNQLVDSQVTVLLSSSDTSVATVPEVFVMKGWLSGSENSFDIDIVTEEAGKTAIISAMVDGTKPKTMTVTTGFALFNWSFQDKSTDPGGVIEAIDCTTASYPQGHTGTGSISWSHSGWNSTTYDRHIMINVKNIDNISGYRDFGLSFWCRTSGTGTGAVVVLSIFDANMQVGPSINAVKMDEASKWYFIYIDLPNAVDPANLSVRIKPTDIINSLATFAISGVTVTGVPL